jgi:hypothetical protein
MSTLKIQFSNARFNEEVIVRTTPAGQALSGVEGRTLSGVEERTLSGVEERTLSGVEERTLSGVEGLAEFRFNK